jgi:hypothetical protein
MSINSFLKELGTGDTVKDYTHASKLFVGDNYRLAPKTGWIYHVYFDLEDGYSASLGPNGRIEAGMLVKSVDLPKFSVETKTHNSYNRPNVVQNKIKYEPCNMVFHDDHADVVRALWFKYYNHYYRDADLGYADGNGTPNAGYDLNTKYSDRSVNSWGFTPKHNRRMIKSISIYSMSQKRFAQYTLINPVITAFRHGQHSSAGTDTMQHEMTVSYESVIYGSGWVSKDTVRGFADIHYDTTPSTLTPANGTRSILGPGGLLNTADSIVTDLGKGNIVGSAFSTFRGYQTLKNTNLVQAAKSELTQLGTDWLRNDGNALSRIFVPNLGNSVAGTPTYAFNYGRIAAAGDTRLNSANPATTSDPNSRLTSPSLLGGIINIGLGALSGGLAAITGAVTSNGSGQGIASLMGSAGTALSQFGSSISDAAGSIVTGAGSLSKIINIGTDGTVLSIGDASTVGPDQARIDKIRTDSGTPSDVTPESVPAAAAQLIDQQAQAHADQVNRNAEYSGGAQFNSQT